MPKIDFLGKGDIAGHHLSVPFQSIKADARKSAGSPDLDGNLIVHGDNLLALKSLLPRYMEKVKCIYIDPPYNIGNEDWVYNDKVNSPLMKEWLGKVINSEDQCRHDKWLCMMYPRLSLLRELLSEDGAIFVSIDDEEQHRLRNILDEIFGADNFVALITVVVKKEGRQYGDIAKATQYVLCYRKSDLFDGNEIHNPQKVFPYEDEIGRFFPKDLKNGNSKFHKGNRPNLYYPISIDISAKDKDGFFPIRESGKKLQEVYPKKTNGFQGVWRWEKNTVLKNVHNLVGKQDKDGTFSIHEKSRKPTSIPTDNWDDKNFYTSKGNRENEVIFGVKNFENPKPLALVKQVLSIGSGKNDIILDSFAGSGTTAHAVLSLNKEDGGNRKFILVECEDYADSITAERVRRVIKGVPDAKDEELKKGLGGNFTYATFGEEIDEKKILTGEAMPSWPALARHVFWLATGTVLDQEPKPSKSNFVGKHDKDSIYLLYQPDISFMQSNKAVLTGDTADALSAQQQEGERIIYYAAAAYVSQKDMDRLGIVFCQLPWAITKKLVTE